MDKIKIGHIQKVETSLRRNAQNGVYSPGPVLDLFMDIGAYSCFYYDAVYDVAIEDHALSISMVRGPELLEKHLGLTVGHRITALYLGEGKPVPQKAKEVPANKEIKELHVDLGIFELQKIHLQISDSVGTIIGAITFSWKGIESLCHEQISFIELLCGLLSKNWSLANECLVEKLTQQAYNSISHDISQQDIVENFAKILIAGLGARVVAVFKFDWYSNDLTKVVERFSQSIKEKESLPLAENYTVGDMLTGVAWENVNFRHIYNFQSVTSKFDFHVAEESLAFHKEKLKQVESILYCDIGTRSRYMFRLINREGCGGSYFLRSDEIVLNRLCARFTRFLDELVANSMLHNLQEVSKSAVTNIQGYKKTINKIQTALHDECINSIGVMAYNPRFKHFDHIYFTSNDVSSKLNGLVELEGDSFYTKCANVETINVMAVNEFDERFQDGHILSTLNQMDINYVVIVPFDITAVKGFLMVLVSRGVLGTKSQLASRLPQEHKKSLRSYAAVVGSCIESADSHLTSENAQRLIGQIGHEVEGPIAELANTTINIIAELEDIVRENNLPSHWNAIVDNCTNSLEDSLSEVRVLLEVAIDMAQESEGAIQVRFSDYDLSEILRAAKYEALRDEYKDYNEVTHRVEIVMNEAASKIPRMVGDKALLKRVFVNIFRNAIKYSLPRYKNKPIVINVNANPQKGQIIIEIINWGVPVHDNARKKIFKPFERGQTHDFLKARRGMGLGLYISRRFLGAHNGTIYCLSSNPTLDDPKKRYSQGYKTCFEVRLPYSLSPGTYNYEV
jgi:signal transduction histidine kinase